MMKMFKVSRIRSTVVMMVSLCLWATVGGQSEDDFLTSGDRVYAQWSWHNADVRSVFEELSKVSGVDFVLSDAVSGKVSLSVTNKTWKDVCEIICKVRKLAMVKQSTYIYVLSEDEYAKDRLATASNNQAVEQLAPLEREVVRLSNTSAAEMKGSIESLLSARGKVTVVEHNNALIVLDTRETIQQVVAMIKRLDVETEQISISAKIIEVGSGSSQNIGVQWGLFSSINGTQASAEHLPGNDVVASALERLRYGILGQDKFAVTLEYLLQENKADVVAQPSITTVDNKEARIFMGGQVPLTYRDEAGNTLVKYIDAGTELLVTPHVTNGKRIMMDIRAKKESASAEKPPTLSSQTASTNVVVSNGETVVIAGLTSNEVVEGEEGIPLLKDIPFLGNLFKRSQSKVSKKDLIIFVTPHIIQKDIETIAPQAGESATAQ